MAIFTTLNDIREHSPCASGWSKLLKSLGKTHSDDAPLSLKHILSSNGVIEATWTLRAIKNHDKQIRLFACKCARIALPLFEEKYPDDARPRKAIDAAESFAQGEIDENALGVAHDAAKVAYATYPYADCTSFANRASFAAFSAFSASAADVSEAAFDAIGATHAAYSVGADYAAAYAATKQKTVKIFRELCNS